VIDVTRPTGCKRTDWAGRGGGDPVQLGQVGGPGRPRGVQVAGDPPFRARRPLQAVEGHGRLRDDPPWKSTMNDTLKTFFGNLMTALATIERLGIEALPGLVGPSAQAACTSSAGAG